MIRLNLYLTVLLLRIQDSNSLLGSNCIWTVRFHVHNNPLNDSLLSGEIRKPDKKFALERWLTLIEITHAGDEKKTLVVPVWQTAVIESQSQKFLASRAHASTLRPRRK